MVDRNILIGIGILVAVAIGFFLISNITGNVVTGSVVTGDEVKGEYFKISDDDVSSEEVKINGEVISDGAQNISG